jgi:glutamate dehydrogenase
MTKDTTKEINAALNALPGKASAGLKDFLKTFYSKAPVDDVCQNDAVTLARAAQSQWALTAERETDEAAIRIYCPSQDEKDWPLARTVIDIVQDDRSFIIDSIVAEIVRQNYQIVMLLHPILHIERSKDGKVKSVSAQPGEGTQAQSHMHIQLRGILSDAQCEELQMGLQSVSRDVYVANRDWPLMREKLRAAEKELSKAPSQYNDHLIEEYQAFLEYLYDNNFTLLGTREYKFVEKKGEIVSETIKGKSLGLLGDEIKPVYINEARKGLSQPQQKMRKDQEPVTIAKVNRRSTVHRRVPLDAIAVKTFDKKGDVVGETLFIGLFTSVTYSRSVIDIPYLRMKVQNIMNRTSFQQGSHNRKALRHILERYPRDEVLQISEDELYEHAISIMRLQERPRIALYTRTDPFGRYISCLVYVPRERYETRLRLKIQHILEQELGGQCTSYQVTQDDAPLARVIYWVDINHLTTAPEIDAIKIEEKLDEAGRQWGERLRAALEAAGIENSQEIAALSQKYGQSFPISYHEQYLPKQSIHDIRKIENVLKTDTIDLDLYRPHDCSDEHMRLKVYSPHKPITLSDILPMLENMGLRVISELPFEVQPARVRHKIFVHDFLLETAEYQNALKNTAKIKPLFEEAFARIWLGGMENDSLNRLVLGGQMAWREITILRTYVRYMQQMRYPLSRPMVESALTANPTIAAVIVRLFLALHDPANGKKADILAAGCAVEIDHILGQVASLDHDRILRSLTTLVNATLRTNYFQTDENGNPKTYLSIKLESPKLEELPEPRPYREIFVYSPRMEGVHLRADKVARGGIRWSDRNEDFRTEILGLLKAQQVKNSVIVPMGAKGGFVLKQPPKEGGRAAFQAEGIECYKILIRGLLDITDNRQGDAIVPPKNVVRRDSDDPYLVVAADKGTATFSDLANSLSAEYGFWLDDAFASGGSAGYDHKKMGITARGAWESVKRHFRELNHDTQTQDFDVVGVGDMGGDVFGNGMLLSEHIRLVGAFNHLHIFCDPDPDTAKTFKERQRLFNDVKGWDEYNTKLLSKGGKIFLRSEKSLELTPEIQKAFDLPRERVTPNELIQAMLKARVSLLFFGGIGTYIKATTETHADVGDKANDLLRINATEVRAKVIGEGANLGMTQRSRVEYAENGGRLNADYIDNSGGVDCSDHEVNIKILLGDVVRKPKHKMDIKARNKLLESMTGEVAELVLRDNYQQAQGISLMELHAVDNLGLHVKFIEELERTAGLKRALEGLPSDEVIQARARTGKGLARPELAILQSHAKIYYTRALLESDIPESKAMEERLLRYFPTKLAKSYESEIAAHMLRREIICTTLAGGMVNRMGPTFLSEKVHKTAAPAAEVARAYIIVREAFGLRDLWTKIESLDSKVPAQVQLRALHETARMTDRAVTWFLTRFGRNLDINRDIAKFEEGINAVRATMNKVVPKDLLLTIQTLARRGVEDGLPEKLAHDISLMPILGSACDIIRISGDQKTEIPLTAKIYFEIGEFFHLDWMRQQGRYLHADDRWSGEALEGIIDHLYTCQAGITIRILKDMGKELAGAPLSTESILHRWLASHGAQALALEPLFNDLRKGGTVDLPVLVIAEQRLRNLYGG